LGVISEGCHSHSEICAKCSGKVVARRHSRVTPRIVCIEIILPKVPVRDDGGALRGRHLSIQPVVGEHHNFAIHALGIASDTLIAGRCTQV